MNLKKYFTFEGRISRGYYFGIPILLGILTIPLSILAQFSEKSIVLTVLYLILHFGISIAMLIVHACITVQRLHDIERPGTHFWLLFIPFYNIYLGIVLLFIKGTDGPNEYGDDPLATVYN